MCIVTNSKPQERPISKKVLEKLRKTLIDQGFELTELPKDFKVTKKLLKTKK